MKDKNFKWGFLFLALLTFPFCHQNKVYVYQASEGAKSTRDLTEGNQIIFDSFSIPVEKILGEPKGNYAHSFIFQDTAFLVLEDCEKNNINIYNLSDFSSFSLHISTIEDLCRSSHVYTFLNPRSFFLLNQTGDLFSVREEKSEWLCNLNENPQMISNGLGIPPFLKYHNEIHLKEDSLLFFPIEVAPGSRGKLYSSANYHYPITGELNLNNLKVSFTGIKYPKFFHIHNFGLLNRIYQNFFNEKLLYCFEATPEIWQYAHNEGKLEKFVVKSLFDKDPCQPISFKRTPETKDLLFNHLKTSPYYHRLIFDPFKQVYYRFYAHPLPEKGPDGLYSTTRDKRYSIMVLDKNFNLLAERPLPDECFFIYFSIPTKEALLINFGPINAPLKNGIKCLGIEFQKTLN